MRRFLIITGAIILAYAAWQWINAVREEYRLNWAMEARTIVLACDLSKQGKYSGKLEKLYRSNCKDELRVVVEPPEKEGEAKASLTDLRANLVIKNEAGERIIDGPVTIDTSLDRVDAAGRLESVIQFHLRENGSYDVELGVTNPAEGLAGRQHHIEGRYCCCGLEQLSVFILFGWAGLVTLVGGPMLLGGLSMRKTRTPQTMLSNR
jgi:hypothetical protein